YYKMIVLLAMGEDPLVEWRKRSTDTTHGYAKMLFSEKNIKEIKEIKYKKDLSKDIYDFTLFVKEGEQIRKFMNSNDCIGQIIVSGSSKDSCLKKIKELEKTLEFKGISNS